MCVYLFIIYAYTHINILLFLFLWRSFTNHFINIIISEKYLCVKKYISQIRRVALYMGQNYREIPLSSLFISVFCDSIKRA